jgi:hypothetical protein
MADIKVEIFGDTGEVIEREFTAEETAQRKVDALAHELRKAEQADIAAAKATAKAALLDRLGITADEAALLLA